MIREGQRWIVGVAVSYRKRPKVHRPRWRDDSDPEEQTSFSRLPPPIMRMRGSLRWSGPTMIGSTPDRAGRPQQPATRSRRTKSRDGPNSYWMKDFATKSESSRKDEKEFAGLPASHPIEAISLARLPMVGTLRASCVSSDRTNRVSLFTDPRSTLHRPASEGSHRSGEATLHRPAKQLRTDRRRNLAPTSEATSHRPGEATFAPTSEEASHRPD
jgi:hypothetical protein